MENSHSDGLLPVWVLAASDQRGSEPSHRKEISICEALQNFQRYNGKLVTIRGIYFFELRETCGREVVTGNRTWPAIIQPLNSYKTDVHANFTTDFGSLKALDELTWREAQAHKREEIWVKISGSLQVVDVNKYASEAVVRGFGHSGNFPAALFRAISVEGVSGTDAGNNKTIGPAGAFSASNVDV